MDTTPRGTVVNGLTEEELDETFPFRLQLDGDHHIVQAGSGWDELDRGLTGTPLERHFDVVRPAGSVHAALALARPDTILMFFHRATGLSYRAQLLRRPPGALLIGAPWAADPDLMARLGLHFDAFAAHDATPDFLLLLQSRNALLEESRRLTAALEARNAELSRSTEALATARDEALQSLASRVAFVATLAHEVRSPMNGILGMASVMLDEVENPVQRVQLQTIRASGDRLLRLLDDVLDWSRFESGHAEAAPEALSPRLLVEDVVALFAEPGRAKGVDVLWTADPATPDVVLADPSRIQQVLVNLVNNAVKFTPTGEVEVHLGYDPAANGGELVLSVRDTGIGVPEAVRERIFQPFRQADPEQSRRFGGTGLGLAISTRAAILLGGSLVLAPSSGPGSTFIVRIPAPPTTGGPAAAVAPLPGLRTLVVSLRAPRGRALCAALSLLEVPSDCAVALPDALRLAEDASFDLLLLDAERDAAESVSVLAAWGRGRPDRPVVLAGSSAQLAALRALVATTGEVLLPHRLKALRAALVAALRGQAPAPERPLEAPKPAGRRVLVVDDDEVNRSVASALLRKAGFVVQVAPGGTQALSLLAQGNVDVVLMDVEMPGIDGLETTKRARAAGLTLPIIAVTAYAFEDVKRRCLDAGMDAFVTKPFRLATITEVIDRLLPPPAPFPATTHPGAGADSPLAALDPAARRAVLDSYVGSARRLASELRQAIAHPDLDQLRRAAHGLKGAAATLGRDPLAQLAGRVEAEALSGHAAEATLLGHRLAEAALSDAAEVELRLARPPPR